MISKRLVGLCIGLFLIAASGCSQNIALHKTYTQSSKPNYKNSALPDDITSLTDGKHTEARPIWTERSTVGWKSRRNIRIDIDLEKKENIGKVKISAAANKANVYFPQNIYVFVSNDRENYEYITDIMSNYHFPHDKYRKEVLKSPEINKKARYVSIFVIPEKKFFFADEIEVSRGDHGEIINNANYTFENLDNLAKDLKSTEHDRIVNEKLAEQLEENNNKENVLENDEIGEQDDKISERNILKKRHQAYLNTQYDVPYIINKINPWKTVQQLYTPTENDLLTYNYVIPHHGIQYGAFTVTNTLSHNQEFEFTTSQNIQLFKAPFIPFTSGKEVVDAIVPLDSTIRLKPGETLMFFFEIKGNNIGRSSDYISVESNLDSNKININSEVVEMQFPSNNNFTLNTNPYVYFHRPMLRKHIKETIVAQDIENHHVNVVPIRYTHFPDLKSADFSKLEILLKELDGVKYILINKDYKKEKTRNEYESGKYLSDEWKEYFKSWYKELLTTVEVNLPDAEVYFYPYDEINTEEDIENFKRLISWAKKEVPGIKFYVTFNNPDPIQELLPMVDIAQISTKKEGMLENLPLHNAEVWTYENWNNGRERSSYKFYRLKGWQAYVDGVVGTGFWTYADQLERNNINDLVLNGSMDHLVIYNGPDGTIISSRRWEAFKLGIEDYEIIYQYAQKYGREATLPLVKEVVDNPDDYERADEIRNFMMEQLLKK